MWSLNDANQIISRVFDGGYKYTIADILRGYVKFGTNSQCKDQTNFFYVKVYGSEIFLIKIRYSALYKNKCLKYTIL